ncbi:hypothetical protein PRBEI_2001832100 [Prionailurus iriomotensis]
MISQERFRIVEHQQLLRDCKIRTKCVNGLSLEEEK